MTETRPQLVVIGALLFAASLLLGFLKLLFVSLPSPIWIAVVVIVVMAGLIFAVWSRQNWARWLLLILFFLGLPALFAVREALAQQGTVSVLLLFLQTIAQAVGSGCLFAPSSNAWFRRRKEVQSPQLPTQS